MRKEGRPAADHTGLFQGAESGSGHSSDRRNVSALELLRVRARGRWCSLSRKKWALPRSATSASLGTARARQGDGRAAGSALSRGGSSGCALSDGVGGALGLGQGMADRRARHTAAAGGCMVVQEAGLCRGSGRREGRGDDGQLKGRALTEAVEAPSKRADGSEKRDSALGLACTLVVIRCGACTQDYVRGRQRAGRRRLRACWGWRKYSQRVPHGFSEGRQVRAALCAFRAEARVRSRGHRGTAPHRSRTAPRDAASRSKA